MSTKINIKLRCQRYKYHLLYFPPPAQAGDTGIVEKSAHTRDKLLDYIEKNKFRYNANNTLVLNSQQLNKHYNKR